MNKVKSIINLALAGVATAMGVAVTVLSTVKADIAPDDYIRMLALAVIALGLLALSNLHEDVKELKEEVHQ